MSTGNTNTRETVSVSSILRPSSPPLPLPPNNPFGTNPFGTVGSNPFASTHGLNGHGHGHGRPPVNGVFPRSSSPEPITGGSTRPSRRARQAPWTTTDDEDDSTVPMRPTLQLPRALVVSGLEFTGVPSQRALSEALAAKRIVLDDDDEGEGEGEGEGDGGGVWNLPDGFFVVYVCPLDPRERPGIHKSLVSEQLQRLYWSWN